MKDRYIQQIHIPCYDTDSLQLLKPSSFMDLAQEAANIHADILGFGYGNLIETRMAWVLSRMHIRFLKHPAWRDDVTLSTWHKGPERLFYLRDFLLSDSDGNALVAATTSWLVLNIDTRRLVRNVDIATEDICRDNAIETPCDKISVPEDMSREQFSVHEVSYSDIDLNGHTNNARYLQWAMDAVPYSIASAHPLKEARINFNHETMPGDKVQLSGGGIESPESGIVYYIEGEVDGRQAFCAELVF